MWIRHAPIFETVPKKAIGAQAALYDEGYSQARTRLLASILQSTRPGAEAESVIQSMSHRCIGLRLKTSEKGAHWQKVPTSDGDTHLAFVLLTGERDICWLVLAARPFLTSAGRPLLYL